MKFLTFVAAIAVTVPAVLGLTVNTPTNVNQCEPTEIDWSGGTAPYFLTFVPARQTTASAIKQFPEQQGTAYTWTVDLGLGTSFTIALKDSSGSTAYSDIVTVQAGVSSSCLNSNVTETGGTSGTASTGASSGASSTASGSSGSTATGTSSSSTATGTASSSSSHNGAGRLGVSSAFGVAGVMGLVGAMLF